MEIWLVVMAKARKPVEVPVCLSIVSDNHYNQRGRQLARSILTTTWHSQLDPRFVVLQGAAQGAGVCKYEGI